MKNKNLVLLIISVSIFGCRNAETKVNSQKNVNPSSTTESQKVGEPKKWIPSNYEEIEIGKSTRDGVIQRFGKPVWEGEEEIEAEEADVQKELENHNGKRFMLEYRDTERFDGGITILYGERDKIVRAISIYPKTPLSKESIIKKYGDDFVELNSNEKICAATDSSREKYLAKKDKAPSSLVYPQLGMLISLDGNGQDVDRIDYLLTCDE